MSVTRFVDTEELEIRNPLFLLNTESALADLDTTRAVGFAAKYANTASTFAYTGLFRDPIDKVFKLFQTANLPTVDTGIMDKTGGFAYADLNVANLQAFGNLNVVGNMVINGSIETINVNTLTVSDNIIIANAGPSGKPDGGFVVRRLPAAVVTDVKAKESGTSSTASASATTITLQAANGHGTALNYYVGWSISTSNDVTGSSLIISSTATNPSVLTLSTALSASPSINTTYKLYNRQNVGSIYSESGKSVSFLGFPREDLMSEIHAETATGFLGDGNVADYVDVRTGAISAVGSLSVNNSVKLGDNVVVANAGTSTLAGSNGLTPVYYEDSGYVSKRTPAFVATRDTPKTPNLVLSAAYSTTVLPLNLVLANPGKSDSIGFYNGWVVRYSVGGIANTTTRDTANAVRITASTTVSNVTTLTLSAPFPVTLATTDCVDLYNKGYVGQVFDESLNTLGSYAFPREDAESVLDPYNPVNGNVVSYVNTAAQDVRVNGKLYLNSATLINTFTYSALAGSILAADVMAYDIIYINAASSTTYTLPTIASVNVLIQTNAMFPYITTPQTSRSRAIMVINMSVNPVTIQATGSDMIETRTQLTLSRLFSKTVLVVSSEFTGAWFIKG